MTNLRIAIEEIEANLPENVEIHVDLVVHDVDPSNEPGALILRETLDRVNLILIKHRAGSLDTNDVQAALDGSGLEYDPGVTAHVAIELN